MVIFSQDRKSFILSERVDVFNVEFDVTKTVDGKGVAGRWVLSADNYELGDYTKEQQALKALDSLALAIANNQDSYCIARTDD